MRCPDNDDVDRIVRILFWDRDGFCIVAKKLEKGTFRRVKRGTEGASHVEIDSVDLAHLLEGIEVKELRRSARYRSGAAEGST